MNPAEFVNIAQAEEQMWWFRGMRKILSAWISRLPETPSGSVLEAGCGTGYMSQWLAKEYGWQMTPLDLEYAGLRYGQRLGIQRLTQGDITALPFRTSSFDALISLDVVVHLPQGEESRAFGEFLRVLKPGAPLILRVSALDALRSRHSEFASERQRFDRRRLLQAIDSAGFRLLEASYANSFLVPVAWAKFRIWEEFTNQPPQSGVVVPSPLLNRLLEQPLLLESILLRAGIDFPVGQSLLLLAQKP